MLNLVYSSQTEALLDALVADLEAERRAQGPLQTAHLVVQNRNIETFVRFGVARTTGIAANLEFHLLRRFVGELLARDGGLELLDADAQRALVLGQLLDEQALRGEALAPVRAYLRAAGESRDAMDLRRVQLAEQLGRLFEEYGFSRTEMLRAWPHRPVLTGTPLAATESWQRALWLQIFGEGAVLATREKSDGRRRVQLGALLDVIRPEELELPPRIQVFGVSYVARVFQRIFALLAQRTELVVYALNPCREFWEDVPNARRAPPRRGESALTEEDPFELATGENAALRLWGKPGRENIRLLNELAECDFRAAFPEPEALPDTLLGRLQREILLRAPPAAGKREADASVKIYDCPSVRREAEVVAEEIWALVQDDAARAEPGRAPLRFNEIAVIVAGRDHDAYFAQVGAALQACHQIPHNIVDLELASTSRIAEAVGLLLALPGGGFTRPELLDVLTHPASMARFPGVEPELWVGWCEQLEILRGADRGEPEQGYLERDVYNWDQGLRRLALGAFMTGERSGDLRAVALGAEQYFPAEHDRERQPAAAGLAMAARSLLADARFARDAELTLPQWAVLLASWVEAHFAASTPQEERELERVLEAIRSLAEVDLGGREVGYRVAHELVAGALGGLGGGRGQHLADGVVVSTSQPMRALPFRAVFMVGLGEGEFPAAERRDALDLRAARIQAGDVSPRERDRYLFLETLLCARERLVLSYVGRNAVTGEERAPSSVVLELLEMLEASSLGPGGRQALVTSVNVRRHVDAGSEGRITFPEVQRERAVEALRASLRAASGGGLPDLGALREGVEPAVMARLAEVLALPKLPTSTLAREGPTRLSFAALRKFLECPLQGYARYELGLEPREDEDEPPHERADEALETSLFEATRRLTEVLLAATNAGPTRDFASTYDVLCERLAASGRSPGGVFGEVEREGHLAILGTWDAQLSASAIAGARLGVHHFGGAQENEVVEAAHPPILLEVKVAGRAEPVQVELRGRVGPLAETPRSSVYFRRSVSSSGPAVTLRKLGLGAYVDQLALAAAGLHEGPHRAVALFSAENSTAKELELAAISAKDAGAQLAVIVGDLLAGGHAHLLPCEAVFAAQLRTGSIAHEVERLLEQDRSKFSSSYGPIRDLSRYAPLPDPQAAVVVERRLGSYFARLRVLPEGER